MTQMYTLDHQYVITDVRGEYDALAISDMGDGVIAPLGTAVCVFAGTPAGMVDVILRVLGGGEEPPEQPATAVAAACDIDVPSGTLDLRTSDNGLVERHDFGSPQRCRVLVAVTGRDEASDPANPPEVHHVWVQVVQRPTPRWRSQTSDATSGYLGGPA